MQSGQVFVLRTTIVHSTLVWVITDTRAVELTHTHTHTRRNTEPFFQTSVADSQEEGEGEGKR